jgi:hypothetical protein
LRDRELLVPLADIFETAVMVVAPPVGPDEQVQGIAVASAWLMAEVKWEEDEREVLWQGDLPDAVYQVRHTGLSWRMVTEVLTSSLVVPAA